MTSCFHIFEGKKRLNCYQEMLGCRNSKTKVFFRLAKSFNRLFFCIVLQPAREWKEWARRWKGCKRLTLPTADCLDENKMCNAIKIDTERENIVKFQVHICSYVKFSLFWHITVKLQITQIKKPFAHKTITFKPKQYLSRRIYWWVKSLIS